MQESVKIESKDLSIEDLYKDFYSVPDFQREYVWKREQVEKLLEDIHEEFFDEENRLMKGPEYFLGSIVVCRDSDGCMSLVDGQQRMTTIYLLLCAIRDRLSSLGESAMDTLNSQIAASSIDDEGKEVHRQRLTLRYTDSKGILQQVVTQPDSLDAVKENTTSVKRIRSAYQDIYAYLQVNFDEPKRLRQFYAAFTKRVKLIRIITPSLTNALKVFETVNDRGVGLNAMDLLKNLLFIKTEEASYTTLTSRWKELVNKLDGCREKPLRFLRYYVMAHFPMDAGKPLREDDIYDWFQSHIKETGMDTDPLAFVDTLLECVKAWAGFLEFRDVQGLENANLRNLSLLSGAARQHYILLLAGRHLPADAFSVLCKAIENLFFCYIATREPTKTFERNFTLWAGELRSVTTREELEEFLARRFTPDMAQRRESFIFAFVTLTQRRIQRYRLRYILAKLTQYVEQQAWGNTAHASLVAYIDSSVEVEHILPQTPGAGMRESFDESEEYDEYVEKLGNLTLLEKTINGSVSNGLFSTKRPGYAQSQYLLTKSLAEKPKVGVNTKLNRAVEVLHAYDTWDSHAIEDRQAILTDLALQVWGFPDEKGESD